MTVLRLGILFSASGDYGALGRDCRDGAMTAIEDMRGECSIAIEPIARDPAGSSELYIELARRMLQEDRCRHVIGTVTSQARKDVIPIIEKHDALRQDVDRLPQAIMRFRAAQTLGTIGPEAKIAISDLVGLLKDPATWEIRQASARGQAPGAMHWYKGNTHTHTLNSDGDSTPDDVVRWYREHFESNGRVAWTQPVIR